MSALRLALAQVNPCVGDLPGNAELVIDYVRSANDAGAHMVAFPEMMLTGYPIEDLALRPSFQEASKRALNSLAQRLLHEGLGDLVVIVGFLDRIDDVDDQLGRPRGAPARESPRAPWLGGWRLDSWAGWLARWLPGWLAGWPIGRLASWLGKPFGSRRTGSRP